MKWPTWPTPAELLYRKISLVIGKDLQPAVQGQCPGATPATLDDKAGASAAAAAAAGGSARDTWPPKMRKKRPRNTEQPAEGGESQADATRPATASLDAPLVLDPRFINKLDMSLISKEHLSMSLTRMNLSIQKESCPSDNKMTTRNHKTLASNNNYLPTCNAGRSHVLPIRADSKQSNDPASISPDRSDSRTLSRSPEGKRRLDDNNNRNKLLQQQQQQQQLSPLVFPSAVDTSSLRKKPSFLPEACRSCRRETQPERLHSHSRSPTTLSSPSVIPVRTFGCANSRNYSRQPSTESPRSVVHSAQPASMEGKLKNEEILKKRRPRSVTCYICGREFGSASFPIHEPKCLERWHRENKALPVNQRRKIPERPSVPIDHEDWNAAAWEQSQALLIPCPKCKRTFLPDRLAVHEKSCRNQKGKIPVILSGKVGRRDITVCREMPSEPTRPSPRASLGLCRSSRSQADSSNKSASRIAVRKKNCFERRLA